MNMDGAEMTVLELIDELKKHDLNQEIKVMSNIPHPEHGEVIAHHDIYYVLTIHSGPDNKEVLLPTLAICTVHPDHPMWKTPQPLEPLKLVLHQGGKE